MALKTLHVVTLLAATLFGLGAQSLAAPGPEQAVDALARRMERLRNLQVSYRELTDTSATGSRPERASLEFHARMELTSSSGWALAINRTPEKTRASLLEFCSGTLRLHELRPSPSGWVETRPVMVVPEVVHPEQYVTSFFHHEFVPSLSPNAAVSTLTLLVDGRLEKTAVVAAHDSGSSMTLSLAEPGVVSYRGKSPHMEVEEQVEEFTREPVLGLVPRRRVIRTEEPSGTRKSAHFELEELRVNAPTFALGEADTSGSLLRRYAP